MVEAKTQFVLRGFTHSAGFRVFQFERVSRDAPPATFAVQANMALAQTHKISLQELPLLCRSLLERCFAGDERRAFVFEEADMRLHEEAEAARSAEARRKRAPRRPVSPAVGASWRGPQH